MRYSCAAPLPRSPPVRSIDRYQVGEGHRGPITEKIQKEFFRIVHGEDGDKRNWLVPVKK